MAEHAPFFSLLEVEGRNFHEVLRTGTQQHLADTVVLIKAGLADGTIRDESATMLALGVVGIVGHYSPFHRTNRIKMPLPALPQFVARWVVHSAAAHDQAAPVALPAPATGSAAGRAR